MGRETGLESKSNLELITAFEGGSAQSFETLYMRYARQIHVFIYHMLGKSAGRQESAKDLTQEAFLQAHRKIGQLKSKEKFVSWLYSIARNATLNYIKHHKDIFSATSIEDASEGTSIIIEKTLNDSKTPSGQVVVSREEIEMVRAGILKLEPKDREAVVLCDINGLPHKDVADIIGCSVGSLDVRLSRAKVRLAKILRAI